MRARLPQKLEDGRILSGQFGSDPSWGYRDKGLLEPDEAIRLWNKENR
jgi:hypothetical protein